MERATFEFADKSCKQSIRVALYDDLADVVEHAPVGTTISLSRLRVRPFGGDGWTGFVAQGGAAKIVDESSSDWIDPAPREGLLLVFSCLFS